MNARKLILNGTPDDGGRLEWFCHRLSPVEFAGSGRRNDGPAQRVTRAEALLMWTRDAARAIGWDGVGTLASGNHADLIVVDRDPLACPLAELPGTRVLRTVLGGRTVWDAGAL